MDHVAASQWSHGCQPGHARAMTCAISGSEVVATFSFDPVLTGVAPPPLGLCGIFTALAIVAAAWFTLSAAGRRDLPAEAIEQVGLRSRPPSLTGQAAS